MDFDKRWLLWGGVGLVGVWVVSRYMSNSNSGDSVDAVGPALISYVSPGGGSLDQLYPYTGSQYGPQDSGALTANQNPLAQAAADSAASTQNILNSDTLLSHVTDLVSQQQGGFNFNGKYGFSSNIQASLDIAKAGSPSFVLKTDFTPKDPSNAAKAISDLESQVTYQRGLAEAAQGRLSGLQGRIDALNVSNDKLVVESSMLRGTLGGVLGMQQTKNALKNSPQTAARVREVGFAV